MEYRKLGRTELGVGAVGLGTEYLLHATPETVSAVVAQAVESGVNYIDLLYSTPGFLAKFAPALAPYRDRVILAVHLGAGEVNGQPAGVFDPPVAQRFFDEALACPGIGYADVILVQLADFGDSWKTWLAEALPMARRYRAEGKGRYIALSAHKPAVALHALQGGDFDALMFPVNMAGDAVPGKAELLAACEQQGVGVVAMKPFAGGHLLAARATGHLHWFQAGGDYVMATKRAPLTPAQCLAYALSQQGVCTTVPGVKNTEELTAALHYLEATAEERDFSTREAEFSTFQPGECQYCNHCLPCPAGIDVGLLICLTDEARLGMTEEIRTAYNAMEAKASDCIFCGDCIERCPFNVFVSDRMYEAMDRFGK